MAEKKAIYSIMKVTFDFTALTISYYNKELLRVLEQPGVDYLHYQFVLFQAEYSYWHACIKFQQIIFNDQNNYEIRQLNSPTPKFNMDRENFKVKLTEKARELTNGDDL